jgi:hypothetical protein
MNDGMIEFPRPDNGVLLRQAIRPLEAKRFVENQNFSLLENDSSLASLLEEEEA